MIKIKEITMEKCVFCNLKLDQTQNVILSNEQCLFLQLDEAKNKGGLLEGAGVIVPINHRETVFDLTPNEWEATYHLLQDVKKHLDKTHGPQGYNIGWNCGETGGQHIFHAHLHVIPRYDDEPYAGKGIRNMIKDEKNVRRPS